MNLSFQLAPMHIWSGKSNSIRNILPFYITHFKSSLGSVMHPYQVWPFDYTLLQSVTITIKGMLWLLLFIMTAIPEQRHLQLLSVAQKRIQPCTHDVSHNQLKSLVSSSLSRTHTRSLTEGLAASSDLLESGFSDGACQMADKKREKGLVQQTHHALMTRRWQSTAGLTAPFTTQSTARENTSDTAQKKCMTKDE